MNSFKIDKLDITVAIVSGAACMLLFIPKFALWATFIGITWYFVAGATTKAFKEIIPPMLLAYVLGSVACLAYNLSGFNNFVCALMIGLTVLLIMGFTHMEIFAFSAASFNAYSCLFAGYFLGAFPAVQATTFGDIGNILWSAAWLAICNMVGVVLGWLIIKIGSPKDQGAQ